MKAFFEEYGFVMLSAVVVIALIAIAGGLKQEVQDGISGVMSGFKSHIVDNNNSLKIE